MGLSFHAFANSLHTSARYPDCVRLWGTPLLFVYSNSGSVYSSLCKYLFRFLIDYIYIYI